MTAGFSWELYVCTAEGGVDGPIELVVAIMRPPLKLRRIIQGVCRDTAECTCGYRPPCGHVLRTACSRMYYLYMVQDVPVLVRILVLFVTHWARFAFSSVCAPQCNAEHVTWAALTRLADSRYEGFFRPFGAGKKGRRQRGRWRLRLWPWAPCDFTVSEPSQARGSK